MTHSTPNLLSFRAARSRGRTARAQRGICISVLILATGVAFGEDLPQGWRSPTRAEAGDSWREKSPTRFLTVKGDFDGDGKPDAAELLVNPSTNQFALFVKLGSSAWRMLDRPGHVKSLGRFGIDLVRPGKYETACGKGYGDYACAHGEPDYLVLSRPAIDFIYTESSDSIFYWDDRQRKFVEVLMSD
jgi:hypothetical protein